MTDAILTALEEAAVEVKFRLEDYDNGYASDRQTGKQPQPPDHVAMVRRSINGTLDKVRAAIELRKQELRRH